MELNSSGSKKKKNKVIVGVFFFCGEKAEVADWYTH